MKNTSAMVEAFFKKTLIANELMFQIYKKALISICNLNFCNSLDTAQWQLTKRYCSHTPTTLKPLDPSFQTVCDILNVVKTWKRKKKYYLLNLWPDERYLFCTTPCLPFDRYFILMSHSKSHIYLYVVIRYMKCETHSGLQTNYGLIDWC